MPDRDELEARLRRASQWVAGSIEDRGNPSTPWETMSARAEPLDDQRLFLDDDALVQPGRRNRQPLLLATATVVLLAAVGIPVGLVVDDSGTTSPSPSSGQIDASSARARVISALSATTAAGNWDITYDYSEVPGSSQVPGSESTTPTTTPVVNCPNQSPTSGSSCAVVIPGTPQGPGQSSGDVTVTGTGIIDVTPKAMVADADPSDFGQVILRFDSSELWELGASDGGGLVPNPVQPAPSGQAISHFASLVESTLGTREGAVAMLGIASPTGYLVLDEQEISAVTATGQDTVDGKAVTEYHVSADPSQLASDPSASSDEIATIQAAVTTLQHQGLSATNAKVAVDAQGFIVQSITTYQFSDGGSVTVQADFSNFGCAGTVLMPGQTGPTQPPANCVSPDSPQPTTATSSSSTTTTSPGSDSTPSTTSPSSTPTTTSGLAPTTSSSTTSTSTSTVHLSTTTTSIPGASSTIPSTTPSG